MSKEILLEQVGVRTRKGNEGTTHSLSGTKYDETGDESTQYTTVDVGIRNGKEIVVTIYKRKKNFKSERYIIPVKSLSDLLKFFETGEDSYAKECI